MRDVTWLVSPGNSSAQPGGSGLVIHLPKPGAWVGAYRIVEKLGRGGCGHVYKALRGSRLYAVKVLDTLELDGWARRELMAMLRLELDNVVRLKSFDRWPDAERGYPCIIMEFVPGLPLDVWARRYNPSTRAALTVLLKVVQALREVFRRGVLHRDIKPSNILIREGDGEPVLIDFGFSSVTGVPSERGPGGLCPGTPEYRSPEAMGFLAGRLEGDPHEYGVADELWAVGVTLYWLLTDVLPFGGREEAGLGARIRLGTPRAPHVLNPRVPRAVSALCLRLLEKDPRARFQDPEELCAALEALLADAQGDASWDAPLMDPESLPPAEEEDPGADAPLDSELDSDKARREEPRERSTLPLALAVALAALVVGALGLTHQPARPPVTSARGEATTQAISVREVARPGNPPEAGRDTAPVGDSTPAPRPTAMLRQPKSRSKVVEKPAPRSRPEPSDCVPIPQWLCTAAGVCTLFLTGCPGAQMRPSPPATTEPCPPDAMRTMKETLGMALGSTAPVNLPGNPGTITSTVRAGEIAVPISDNLGRLPPRSMLYGQYIIGESRVYGRFTLARTPKGDTFSVCVQISDPDGQGTLLLERVSGETAKTHNRYYVEAVPRFANTSEEVWRLPWN